MKRKNNLLARTAMVLLLAALSSVGAWAQDEEPTYNPVIVISLNDGSNQQELTYADGYVSISSNSPSTTLSWPIEKLQKLTFENSITAIRDVKATGLDLLSDRFDAYDLSGKLVKKQIKSLSELPCGEYIVKDGRVTIKVVRK